MGGYVEEFEKRLARYIGAEYAVATSSGTAALHIALRVVGVKPGDEVVTVPLTFVATCNAIRYCGGNPVFVDVERQTLGLCPESLGAFLENNTEIRNDGLCWNRNTNKVIRACVPVHNLGHPVRINEIRTLCAQHNIHLVEDSAESLGSFYNGIHTGSFGKLGILSFNGNKIITTGGGGAIISDDEALVRRAKHLTTTAKMHHPWLFLHDDVGFNYRLPNINAALGCGQLEQLVKYVDVKRMLAKRYQEFFSNFEEIENFSEPIGACSNYWLNAIILKDKKERDEFLLFSNCCFYFSD